MLSSSYDTLTSRNTSPVTRDLGPNFMTPPHGTVQVTQPNPTYKKTVFRDPTQRIVSQSVNNIFMEMFYNLQETNTVTFPGMFHTCHNISALGN